MTPRILDDWWWFLMCYWMILFNPLMYAEEIRNIRKNNSKWFK